MEQYLSPVFGLVRKATKEERTILETLMLEIPVDVFQVLSLYLNSLGLYIRLEHLPNKDEIDKYES